MYILIVNEDPLGRALAAALVAHGHEVAYVDESAEYANMVATELGCLVIQGEPNNIRTLQEAGIDRADVLVALLEKDIKNIMVGLFGRQFQVPRILARLRQQHYAPAYELAGIVHTFSAFDYLLNAFLTAIEEPDVRQIMALGDGRVEMAAIDIPDDSPLLGATLDTLWKHPSYPQGALVVGLLKAAEQTFHLPGERPVIEAGDELLVVAPHDAVQRIIAILRRQRRWSLM